MDDWREGARCAQRGDPEDWYSDDPSVIEYVKGLCSHCPVAAECLGFALSLPATDDQWGVFGGLTADERRTLRKAVA